MRERYLVFLLPFSLSVSHQLILIDVEELVGVLAGPSFFSRNCSDRMWSCELLLHLLILLECGTELIIARHLLLKMLLEVHLHR